MATERKRILLDTHVALWLLLDDPKLPGAVRQALKDDEVVWVFHQVSLWEIQIKYDLKKLQLPRAPERVFPNAIRESGLVTGLMENEAIFMLGKLPAVHRDPFDRLLITHAIKNGWLIATVDEVFEQYPVQLL